MAIAANVLRHDAAEHGLELLPPRVEIVFEPTFNRLCAATRNKSSVLFSTTARHLDRLLRGHGGEGVLVVCDRHGGRSRYGPLLRLMFEDWDLTVLDETDRRADYLLSRGDARGRIVFAEKGDALCLANCDGVDGGQVPPRTPDGPLQRLVEATRAGSRVPPPATGPTASASLTRPRTCGDA